MIIEVQIYRSFHAKSGAILRFILVLKIFHKVIVTDRGVDPYGTGGTRPPQYLDQGDMITNVPPNISRVISATFYRYML